MKITYAVAAMGIFALMFSCQPSQEKAADPIQNVTAYVDGIYSATFETADERGWKGFLEVQVRDKTIVSANFDYSKDDGSLKSQDQAYADGMMKASNITPSDADKALLDSLVDKQSADVAAVTGATGTTKDFRILAKAALEKAKAGDASPALVPQGK